MIDYGYAYLVGSLLLFPFWLAAIILRRDLAKEIFTMSLVGGFLAVLFSPPFLADYWKPIYAVSLGKFGGLEDFIYGFLMVGIASVVYEVLFGKHFAKRRARNTSFTKFVFPALILYVGVFYLPVYLGVPAIYAAVFSFLAIIAIVVMVRRDLLTDSLLSGLVLGAMTFAGFALFVKIYPEATDRFWYATGPNSILIAGVPAGELLWAFSLGAAAGPVYEFFAGLKFKK